MWRRASSWLIQRCSKHLLHRRRRRPAQVDELVWWASQDGGYAYFAAICCRCHGAELPVAFSSPTSSSPLLVGVDSPRRHDFDRSANVVANTVLVLIHRHSVAWDSTARYLGYTLRAYTF